MIIDTNIRVKDADGKESCIAARDPKELLRIMQQEGLGECEITVSTIGTAFVKSKNVTLDDVREWQRWNNS